MRVVSCGLAALLLLTASGRSQAADPVADLLGWVPDRANAALFIDADAVQKSDLAVKGKWGAKKGPTFGLDSLPPNIARLVVATQLDPAGGAAWEVMVAAQRKPVTEADFIKRVGGARDTISSRSVVLTEKYGIVTNLAPGVAASYQPPNRQEAGRWLRTVNGKVHPNFSEYLKQAAATVGPNAPVVLAIDTTDMFDPTGVKTRLDKAASLKGKVANLNTLSGMIASIRGVTLTVRIADRMSGEIRADFAEPADALKDVAKPFFLEVLQRMGLEGEEMNGWTATVQGKTVTFGGNLTPETLDLMLSPFLRPSASSVNGDGETPDGADSKAQASLRYYQAVSKKMSEVRKSHNPSYPKLAQTFNMAARHIDDLPILNVDDELLDWGNAISTTFRTMAIVAQATGGQITLLEANKAMVSVSTPNYYYGSSYGITAGYWGGAGYGYNYAIPSGTSSTAYASNYGAVGNLQAMTNQQEGQYRSNTWKNLETANNDIRRKMVKKYGIEF